MPSNALSKAISRVEVRLRKRVDSNVKNPALAAGLKWRMGEALSILQDVLEEADNGGHPQRAGFAGRKETN